MKGCHKIKSLFGPYLYNSVTPDERAAVEEHIDTCEKCATDLRSRQKVLEKIKPHSQLDEIPQRTQDDFAWSVYRRIASEILRRRSRQVFLRRFVLQPSLAALALAGIAIGVLRLHPGFITMRESPSVVLKTDETDKRDLRAVLYVEEFFRKQGTPYQREPGHTVADSASTTTEGSLPGMDYLAQDMLLVDSLRRLEDADVINYSLGDHERALAEYQRLVDDYPGTDAAVKARGRSRAILGMQVESIDIEGTTDTGI